MQHRSRILADAVRRAGVANAAFVHAVGHRLGLNPTDFDCVDLLESSGPLTPGQITAHTGLTTGAVSGLLDRLEAGGWVHRTRDPHDGRRVIVELVSNRHSEVIPHYQGISAVLDRLMRRLDAETQHAVTEVLDELSAAFEAESVRLRTEALKAGAGRHP